MICFSLLNKGILVLFDFLFDFIIFVWGYLTQVGVLVLYLYVYRLPKGMIHLCRNLSSSICCDYEGPFYWRIPSKPHVDMEPALTFIRIS
jgi:hypothetical protein